MDSKNEFEKQLKFLLKTPQEISLSRSHWLKIQSGFENAEKKKRKRRLSYWAMAASILLLIGIFFFYPVTSNKSEAEILAQYGLTEYNFPSLVQQKLIALPKTKVAKSQAEYLDILKNQLYFLDKQYANYLEYINLNGYQEFIGIQIQNYYEVKIELLDKIQKEIKKLKSRNNENSNNINEIEWNI